MEVTRLGQARSGIFASAPNSSSVSARMRDLGQQLEAEPLRAEPRDLFKPAPRMPRNRDQRHVSQAHHIARHATPLSDGAKRSGMQHLAQDAVRFAPRAGPGD